MAALPRQRINDLIAPFVTGAAFASEAFLSELAIKLGAYLDLLLRWNAHTNLTAIREPEEIVRRHFGESLFTAAALQSRLAPGSSLLDFGSGAGFPGLPIQMCLPEVRCCLAESQGKKAAFLREAVRTLGLDSDVWAARVEEMPVERSFDCVTLRAVDRMEAAVNIAAERVLPGGTLAVLGTIQNPIFTTAEWSAPEVLPIPDSERRTLYLYERT